MKKPRPPKQITIDGMDKSFGAILDRFVGNWKLKRKNKEKYRLKWEEFLPAEVEDKSAKTTQLVYQPWSMAYIPRISLRKSITLNLPKDKAGMEKIVNWPYFIVVLNSGRDTRPQVPVSQGEDLLQKNILDKGMVISQIPGFYLCPNGFPYHDYASLLISKDKRPQREVTPKDIETWIKFSFLTEQYVFFNSVGAGASREERFHAQVVDPEVLRYEGKVLEHPIRNENLVKKTPVKHGVYQLEDYPVEALIFVDKDAPHQASRLVMNLEGLGIAYNVLVRGDEVYVIGRNKIRERSDCIGKKVGGYECSGVILVGNVEERILEDAGLERIIHGNEVFSELSYDVICSNLSAAAMPINWMKDLL